MKKSLISLAALVACAAMSSAAFAATKAAPAVIDTGQVAVFSVNKADVIVSFPQVSPTAQVVAIGTVSGSIQVNTRELTPAT